jgi:ABC-2 type transport system ATP-binding protein
VSRSGAWAAAAVDVTELVIRYGRGARRSLDAPEAPAGRGGQQGRQGRQGRATAVTAVEGLSLTAAPAQLTAILGPNGAGKTSTVEACEGLRRPSAGRIRVLGLDPIADAGRLRPRVGVMLQAGGVPGAANAGQVLAAAARLYAHPHSPGELIGRLGIGGSTRTPFRRLSGGEQQRLKLALALVGRPELVFLDEPTAGLDPHGRHAVWDLLRELRASGVSIVLTTHQMDEAAELSDHVVIVDRGRVVAAGSPTALTSAEGAQSIRFRAPGIDRVSLQDSLPFGSSLLDDGDGRYRIVGEVGPGVLASVTAWCAEHSIMPEGLTVASPTLEDVFLRLTGRSLP